MPERRVEKHVKTGLFGRQIDEFEHVLTVLTGLSEVAYGAAWNHQSVTSRDVTDWSYVNIALSQTALLDSGL